MSSYIKGPALQKHSPAIAELSIGHEAGASWHRNGEGFATLRATRHVSAGWVSLTVDETPAGGRTRQVMLTLTQEEAAALAVVQEREGRIDAETVAQEQVVAATPDGGVAAVMDGVFDAATKHNQDQSD